MATKSPYSIIKSRYSTEKTQTLLALQDNDSNPSVRKFQQPKYTFVVEKNANKKEIANALEEIYKEKKVKVTKVNTINTLPKPRRVRGRRGSTASFKKAIVTFEKGDTLE